MTRTKWMRRGALLVAGLPLVLLAGCPKDDGVAPGKVPSQMTAPAANPAATQAAPASTAASSSAPDSQTARAQQLVAQARASYRSGVGNYQKGHLDAARIDFDAAVDLLLSSGLDLKGDPQLLDEFDQLVNAVNTLEMAALKQGNGFSPKVEESPLDTVGDLTFAPDPELTARLRAELQTKSDLPLVINNEVAGYIGAFANSSAFRAHMVHSLERSGRYRAIIQKALADEGLPQDLFYLAVAESGFQPQALNAKSGAGGMWQFMPTGAYGLARNGYVDERFDPEKSSIAYARYMKGLYRQLGDWYLAMAGYDWGPGYVQRAVMKTGYADFWELYRRNVLPKETKDYVPKILAAIIMAKNPARYGLDKVVPDAAMVWDTVNVDYALDLRLVADVTDASLQQIVALNPSLLRMTTPADASFDLHIPLGTRDVFVKRLRDIPESKRASWRFHVVKPGESIETVAAALHAHATDIEETNGLKPNEAIEEGDELVVPVTAASTAARPQRYVARRGDTLIAVADRFNLSVDDLRRWNHLPGGMLRAGMTVKVAEPVALGPSMRSRRADARRGHAPTANGAKNIRGARARGTRAATARSAKTATPRAVSKTSSRAGRSAPRNAVTHTAPRTSKTRRKAAR